jgi:surfactin synthase thioesterase subunit
MNKIKLYCLPFAGGSRYSYQGYIKKGGSFEVIPLEIAGRGGRSNEIPLTDLYAIADDIYMQIKSRLDDPYIIYGHSMGSLLGYLVMKRVIKEGDNKPLMLFFTGSVGPSIRYKGLVDYRLPKTEFYEKLKMLGGSLDAVLADADLMNYFEPILRADFEAVANYKYKESEPFDIPITVVIGSEENATIEEARVWQKETTAPVEVYEIPGNHFFIMGNEQEIINMINDKSMSILQL